MDGLAVASSLAFSSGLGSARQLQGPYSLPARLRFLAASLPASVLCTLDYAPGPALSRRRAREYVRSSPGSRRLAREGFRSSFSRGGLAKADPCFDCPSF